jgi:protein-disulfide isomerase
VLRQWIDAHPDVNWEWHHLPLSIHDPAATRAAELAECAGQTGGNHAFWETVAWLYEHSQDGRARLPSTELSPTTASSKAVQECVQAGRLQARIQTEADAAAHEGVTATPTLRLLDRRSGKSLTLRGPIEGDALLSAIDLVGSAVPLDRKAE